MSTINEPLSAFEKLAGPLDGHDAMDVAVVDASESRQVATDVEAFLAGRPLSVLELEFEADPTDELTLDEWLSPHEDDAETFVELDLV